MTTHQASSEHLLTPADVAALVFVDPKTVSRWARAGTIPSTRTPGGHRRCRAAGVEAITSRAQSRARLRDAAAGPLNNGTMERVDTAAAREGRRAAVEAVVAEAVALA